MTVAIAVLMTAATNAQAVTRTPRRCVSAVAPTLCSIHFHRDRTNQIRARADLAPIPYHWIAEAHPARRGRILTYWIAAQERAAIRLRLYLASPWLHGVWHTDALCVHSHEASWTNPTGIGPEVSGGMQIGLREWIHFGGQAYAPQAYQATPDEQLHVAYRYWKVSGWHPWPNTAAICGLL